MGQFVTGEALRRVVLYLYTADVTNLSIDHAMSVLRCAYLLRLFPLAASCANTLVEALCEINCVDVLCGCYMHFTTQLGAPPPVEDDGSIASLVTDELWAKLWLASWHKSKAGLTPPYTLELGQLQRVPHEYLLRALIRQAQLGHQDGAVINRFAAIVRRWCHEHCVPPTNFASSFEGEQL